MRKSEADFIRKSEAEGWTVLKNGWPDFLLIREDGKKPRGKGAEVKGIYRHYNSTTKQRLSKEQKVMFAALAKLGIEVDVVYQEAEQTQQPAPVLQTAREILESAEEEQDAIILRILKQQGLDAAVAARKLSKQQRLRLY